MADTIDVEQVKKMLAAFAKARDWEKFHSPKNLSMAIAGESGELLEIFQWMTEQESTQAKNEPELIEQVSHELADIILYAIRMADLLSINLNASIQGKIAINNEKYPADRVKGSAKKYNQYLPDGG